MENHSVFKRIDVVFVVEMEPLVLSKFVIMVLVPVVQLLKLVHGVNRVVLVFQVLQVQPIHVLLVV